jgi:aspartyl-tRNA(Asn)/glutamyl-tRNA(Gln) amidotransferase subunit C
MTPRPLTRADVLHIARLARLDLSEDDVERFTAELGKILTYVGEVQRVDTTDVTPMSHAGALSPPGGEPPAGGPAGRDDHPRPCLDRSSALANAPDASAGLFRVPRVR